MVVLFLNKLAATGVLIITTALAFIRWLFNWANLLGNRDVVPVALVTLCVVLGIWVWRRRKSPVQLGVNLPFFRDACCCFALPILMLSAAILAVRVGNHLLVLKSNRAALTRYIASSLPEGQINKRPNVVLIVADALRAQSMSVYGYMRKTTPFLERFAESSNVYTQMYSNSTSTRVSLTSILSGKHPFTHGRLTKFLPIYRSPENLVALLRNVGYTTASIASNVDATFYTLGLTRELVHGEHPNFRRLTLSWLRDNGVYPTRAGMQMYDELAQFLPFLGYPETTWGYGPAEDSLAVAAGLVVKLPQPFFIFIHLHEPHHPYETPTPFRGKYAKMDYDEVNRKISSDHYGRYQPDLQPFVDVHRDHYDEAIEYLDFELAKFVNVLEQNPKTNNSLLIITADHGESFERGFLNHGEDLYESSVHVPLLVKFPGQKMGQRLSTPVQSIDVAPTILHDVGIPVPSWVDGVSLAGLDSATARERIMINYKDPEQRHVYYLPTKLAIRRENFKLIVNCDLKQAEIYDLGRDPNERADLSPSEPLLVKELWRNLEQHLAKQKGEQRMECPFQPGT
jgi:arylsulfatase A-like enzyme